MKLNQSQQKAVFHKPSPLLIVAGAGTGKTTTIIERMSYLINDCQIMPEKLLALTFSNKSAKHLKDELKTKISEKGSSINASTFHSFSQKLNIEFYKEIGYNRPPKLIDDSDVYFLIKNKFNSLPSLKSSEFRRNPYEAIYSIIRLCHQFQEELYSIDMLKNKILSLEEDLGSVEDDKQKEHLFQLIDAINIFPLYLSWKKEKCVFDYGDMIYNLWILLESDFDIRNRIKNRYNHLVVDEFQDNNYALSVIIKIISEDHINLTVVGDDDQCIYAFRGANVYNIDDFVSTYNDAKDYSMVSLMHNYRSTQPILDLANFVIQDLPDRVDKGRLKSDLNGVMPKLLIGDKEQQKHALYSEVTSLLNQGKSLSDIAILCRTNKNCEVVSKYLHSKGIPSEYAADKLFEQSIIKDALSVFEFINKGDYYKQSIIRIINNYESKEYYHVILEAISKLGNVKVVDEYIDNLLVDSPVETIEWLVSLRSIKYDDGQALKSKINDIFDRLVHLNCDSFYSFRDQYLVHCIEQFKSIVNYYIDSNKKASFPQLIDYISTLWNMNLLYVTEFNSITEIDAIKIMTIHQSKGKEFDTVLVPFLSSGQFPKSYKVDNYLDTIPLSWRTFFKNKDKTGKEMHLEDELRVFYVALTRARNNLILLTTEKRQSAFVKNIPDKLINREQIDFKAQPYNLFDDLIAAFELKRTQELSVNNDVDVSEFSKTIELLKRAKLGDAVDWANSTYGNEITDKLKNTPISDSIVTLSASSIDMYNMCSMKYRFKYIDQLPGLLSSKPYLKLGILIHRILEEFHSQGFAKIDDMYMLLDELWVSDGYKFNQQEEQYKEDAKLMLNNYMEYLEAHPANIVEVEKKLSFTMDNCIINGRYDRIDLDSKGNIFIYDYKTSKTSQSSSQLKRNIQLGVYALGIYYDGIQIKNKILKNIYPEKLSILSLRNNDNIESSITFTEDDIAGFVDKINDTVIGISNGEFKATKNFYCDSCDYKELFCPLFNK